MPLSSDQTTVTAASTLSVAAAIMYKLTITSFSFFWGLLGQLDLPAICDNAETRVYADDAVICTDYVLINKQQAP